MNDMTAPMTKTTDQNSLLEELGGPESKDLPIPSNHYTPGKTSGTEERAVNLLGSGASAEEVAAALGVTPAAISHLLSREDFSEKVAELRYNNLQAHNTRDSKYDGIEDKLLDKMEKALPLVFKPEQLTRMLATVNAAKRRGQSKPEQVSNSTQIVSLVLPNVIAERFSVNTDNQVIRAGEQELHTIQSGTLLKQIQDASDVPQLEQSGENQCIEQEDHS